MARTSIATDNFNRASLGTTDWSQMNTGAAGDVQIDSSIRVKGQYSTQATDQKATARWIGAGSFTNDQYASVKLVNAPTSGSPGNTAGVCVRASGSAGTKTFYEAFVEANVTSPPTSLSKWVSGTRTVLYSDTAITWAANDLLSLEVEGTTLRVCKNGTAIGGSWTVTDSSIATGVPGVVMSGVYIYGDDWEGGNIGTAGLTLTPSLFTNSSTFYAPTVIPGAVALTPGLLSNTNVFYSATVSLTGSTQTLTPARFDNANAFYAPTVAPGAVTLTPARFDNANAFYTATVTRTYPRITTPPMGNLATALYANRSGTIVNVYDVSTGVLVLRKTGLTSDSSGVVTFTDSSLSFSTGYACEPVFSDGNRRLPVIGTT